MAVETLHTLNAVRVLAEYVVVHHHLSFLFPSVGGLFAHSTMFGVLRGSSRCYWGATTTKNFELLKYDELSI